MTGITIITNNVPRDILNGWELTPAERDEFDYCDWRERLDEGADSGSFFRYKGQVYDLGDIPARTPHVPTDEPDPFADWHGVASDSFFSGILVRYVEDFERVVIGRYYS